MSRRRGLARPPPRGQRTRRRRVYAAHPGRAQPPSSNTPRAYRLPYTQELERQVAQAAKASKRGERVGLRLSPKRKGRSRGPVQRSSVQFYRLEPPPLPPKDNSG